jgi:predicted transcriptional regulator
MGEDQAAAHFGAGGGGPHFRRSGGPSGGGMHMSEEEARAFFSQFFGHSGPIGRYDAIPNGTVVSLKGLVSRPERNGDRGEIADYDPTSCRYTVLLEDTDEKLKVKATNLLQHVHVDLQGIQNQPALNGQRGTIIAWDPHKERYNIYVMELSKVVSLKPSNVILENGTVAKIDGLSAEPELNGKFGTIMAWIQDSNRYEVQLSASHVVLIKAENVRV